MAALRGGLRACRRIPPALAIGVLLVAGLRPLPAAQPPAGAREYALKAAFLMNFTKFVAWPPSAFRDPASPLTICVMGEDPFDGILDQIVAGETAGGRKLAVERIHRVPARGACQVLFVSRSVRDPADVAKEAGPGVLTVGDEEGFLRDGGIIAFVVQSRHVRFDVNLQAASRASLDISARLLNVARVVHR